MPEGNFIYACTLILQGVTAVALILCIEYYNHICYKGYIAVFQKANTGLSNLLSYSTSLDLEYSFLATQLFVMITVICKDIIC